MNNFSIIQPFYTKIFYIGEIKNFKNGHFDLMTASFGIPPDFIYFGQTKISFPLNITKCDDSWDSFANKIFHDLCLNHQTLTGLMEYQSKQIQVDSIDKTAIKMYKDKAWFALWDYLQ